MNMKLIERLKQRAERERSLSGGLKPPLVADLLDEAANHLKRLELALLQISGHGNITGERAREIATEALNKNP